MFSLNVNKSNFMLFYMSGRTVNIPNLHKNSIKLGCLVSFNFLGIRIVDRLTWKEGINLIANKISRTVVVINRLKHYLPQNILLTIYNTLIIPHLNYGILTWVFNSDRILKNLKKIVKSIGQFGWLFSSSTLFRQKVKRSKVIQQKFDG